MEKFTKKELQVLNLIREQKSKDEIFRKLETTTTYFNFILAGLYKKTDEFVGYKTERKKFEELSFYLRKNPTAFSPMPTSEDLKAETQAQKQVCISGDNANILEQMQSILANIEKKHQGELSIATAKIEVISEIKSQFEKIKAAANDNN